MSANGMFVHGLDPIPTNFHDTIPLLRETYLFWRISKGGPGLPEEGGPWDTAMPVWEKFLKEDEMWDAILFLYDFTGAQAPCQGGGARNDLPPDRSASSLARVSRGARSPRCVAATDRRARRLQDVGTEAQRESGKKLYLKNCSQCHGEKGDGEGYAAPHLRPRPRNFTTGKFKIRTTPNGALPTHQDLVNIIRRGMPYTSMPAWPAFSDQEVSDLAYFITTFSPDFSNKEKVPQPVPLPSAPKATKESVELGKKLYVDNGCVKCHGTLGRGDGPSAPTLVDDWDTRYDRPTLRRVGPCAEARPARTSSGR